MTSSNVSSAGNEALGSCLLTLPHDFGEKAVILPCNISDLNDFMCASTNREGQLCGRCREGFAPPVYSYSLTCVNYTDYSLNWLKYLVVAFGPLTVFSVIISVFHISPTSPYLHGFIFTANIICSPNIIRVVVRSNEEQPLKLMSGSLGSTKYFSLFLEYGILTSFVLSTNLSAFILKYL